MFGVGGSWYISCVLSLFGCILLAMFVPWLGLVFLSSQAFFGCLGRDRLLCDSSCVMLLQFLFRFVLLYYVV